MNKRIEAMNKKVILLDAGHGGMINGKYQTAGKRSPRWDDGTQYFEGKGNREIRKLLELKLIEAGFTVHLIANSEADIPLPHRVDEINKHCDAYGAENCLLVSIHSNGFDKETAHGWSVYTTKGETASDKYATALYAEAEKMWSDEKFRKDETDGDPDEEANFYIIAKSKCAAILSENFFHTNERECKKYLLPIEGKRQIAEVHFQMINKMCC